jgi:hypothetical protein
MKQGKAFFFEKKKIKTFNPSDPARCKHAGPTRQKFFGPFLQKRTAFLPGRAT